MPEQITLRLDLGTDELPTANVTRKEHHFAQARKAKILREQVHIMARRKGAVPVPARLTAHISWGDNIHRDVDNVSLKAIIDGLVDAGVLPDDWWQPLPQVMRIAGPIHGIRGRVHLEVTVETLRPEGGE